MNHPVDYRQYTLVRSTIGSGFRIERRDRDHTRTVCFVDSLAQWTKFVAALQAGADEVAAVHAIDGAAA